MAHEKKLEVRRLYQTSIRDTRLAAENYWLNNGFLAGYQWIFWDPSSEQPLDLPADDRIRYVFNRMAANHRTLISNLGQRPMAFEVLPNGANDASAQAAYTATEILYALAYRHKWEHLREKNYVNMLKGGTGIMCVDWDEDRSDTVETALSIVEMVVEPGSYDPEFARWWIKAQVFHPEQVQAMFDMKEPPVADAANGTNPLSEKLLAGHLGVEKVNSLTLVLTYYERPSDENEEGKFCIDVGGDVVQEGPWPFPFTERLNLVTGVETLVEHQWFGESVYSHARSPQVALNMVRSNLSEHLRDAAVSRMLVPTSALKTMEAFNDVPGYMHPYPDGLTPPSWLSPPQLPAWLQTMAVEYMGDLDDIMGVHDVSRGKAPVNLESGAALDILAELDGTPVGRLLKEGAMMHSRLASLVLQIQEKHASGKHLAVIEMGDGPISLEWTGSDIAGQWEARVPLESVIPRSRAAMQMMGMKLLEMDRIQSLEEFMSFVEMPGRRNLINAINPHAAKARRENSGMARGDVLTPATFDNHQAHITEHNNFRVSEVYEMLLPDRQREVDLHLKAHETLASEDMGEAVSRQEEHPALGAVPSADEIPMPPEGSVPPPEPPPEELPPEPVLDQGPIDPTESVDDLLASI